MAQEDISEVLRAIGRLEATLGGIADRNADFRERVENDLREVWVAVDRLRDEGVAVRTEIASARGALNGAHWLWKLLLTLPAALVGYLLGGN